MADNELLPCPFCGGDAQTDFIEGESYLIECYACRAETGIKDSEEDAIAAWSRRAVPEQYAESAYSNEKAAEVDDKRQQDLIDVFDLTWNAAVESAAFYVEGHCADGAHHVEHILELVPPKIAVGGVTVAEVRARRAKADAELWETAMSNAANYVENHCIDGEDHASHMMSMKRPEFCAAPSHTTNKEK